MLFYYGYCLKYLSLYSFKLTWEKNWTDKIRGMFCFSYEECGLASTICNSKFYNLKSNFSVKACFVWIMLLFMCNKKRYKRQYGLFSTYKFLLSRVTDLVRIRMDSNYFRNLDPDPDQHSSEKLDPDSGLGSVKLKFSSFRGLKWSHEGRERLQLRPGGSKIKMEPWGVRRFASLWWEAGSGSGSALMWKFGSGSALQWK